MKPIENGVLRVNALYFAVAAMAQAEHDVRYYLNGVGVEPGPNGEGATMIGTNGHALIAVHDKDGFCNGNYILKTDKRLLQDCVKKTTSDLVVDKDGVMQIQSVPSGGVVYQFPENAIIDGKFPDWRRIIPNVELSAGLPNTFNPIYLELMLNAVKKIKRGGGVSFFHDASNTKDGYATASVLARSGNQDFLGLVMPLRDNVPCVVPDWAKAQNWPNAAKQEEQEKPAKKKKAA